MHKKFEINQTKIKGGCKSGRKVVPHDSKSDLPLSTFLYLQGVFILVFDFVFSKQIFKNYSKQITNMLDLC